MRDKHIDLFLIIFTVAFITYCFLQWRNDQQENSKLIDVWNSNEWLVEWKPRYYGEPGKFYFNGDITLPAMNAEEFNAWLGIEN